MGSLFYFKYMGWFLENLGRLTNTDFSFFRVALPLGVSFYVFQSIAYIADVYRGDAEAERSLLDYAAFQAMFPQLVMGPILRLRDVSAELHTKRPFSRAAVESGFSLFVVGLGCKVVLADQLASLWTALERIGFAYLSAPLAWFGAVGYSLQLYYDFAGYSLMAMGLARMLGFVIPRNFDLPYCSRSISEFWRRWHITLGIWFRDYLYIPLGGNRVSKTKWLRNILVVWLLTGLWHGAAWNFVLWGLFFAVFLTAEKLWYGRALAKTRVFKHIYVLLLVVVSFVLFDANSVGEAAATIGGLFGAAGVSAVNPISLYYLRSFAVVFLIGIVGATPLPKRIVEQLGSTRAGAMVVDVLEPLVLVSVLAVSTGYLVDGSFNPFLYFRF